MQRCPNCHKNPLHLIVKEIATTTFTLEPNERVTKSLKVKEENSESRFYCPECFQELEFENEDELLEFLFSDGDGNIDDDLEVY